MSRLCGGLVLLVGGSILLPLAAQEPQKEKPARRIERPLPPAPDPNAPVQKLPPPEPPDLTLPPGAFGRLGTPQPGRVWTPIYSLAFAPDGKTLAAGTFDKRVHVWDAATGKDLRQLGEPRVVIHAVAFSPDGKTLATGTFDDHLTLWDTETGLPRWQMEESLGEGAALKSLAFSPDGQLLAVAGGSGRVRLREAATGKEVRALSGHIGMVSAVVFSPDGKTLASGSLDRSLRLWEVATGKQLREIIDAMHLVDALAFAPDGATLASAGEDGSVRLWEVAGQNQVGQFNGHRGAARALAFSPDGKTLASGGGSDQTLRLWEVASGKERRQFKARGGVYTLAFAPDGRAVATGGQGDATVLLWDVTGLRKDGQVQARPLQPDEAKALWADLTGADPGKAYQAMWTLAGAPAQAVPLIQERLRMPAADAARRVEQLVADLDSDRFATRQKAMQELEKVGDSAEPVLRKALAGKPSFETRRRIEELLGKMAGGGNPGNEHFRGPRAVEVLEYAGTQEARLLLQRLADAAPESALARDAVAALKRLGKQKP
jgi:WD40 repeat protein